MNLHLAASICVFRHEFASYFRTSIAYIYLCIFVFLAQLLTFTSGSFFEIGEASLAQSFFQWHPLLYAVLIPTIGMRVWTQEQQDGTIELLYAQPVAIYQLVVAKYLAAYCLVLLGLALTFPSVITVFYLGKPDPGEILSGYLGSALMAAAFLAVSCYCSALLNNQVTAYIISCSICAGTVLLGTTQIENEILNTFPNSQNIVDMVSSLSANKYFSGFRRGYIDLQSTAYFLLIILIFNIACISCLNRKRNLS
ncbi:ABC transporter permease [Agaribacterium haliotis]|uniref:ABC transporter permease n=1 Tax=Agaribacterium haliotis TaxID=2013869 RepID=UPI000BB56632|nr:ABC transporter permease subunit [Agaribacterium haliotis]